MTLHVFFIATPGGPDVGPGHRADVHLLRFGNGLDLPEWEADQGTRVSL